MATYELVKAKAQAAKQAAAKLAVTSTAVKNAALLAMAAALADPVLSVYLSVAKPERKGVGFR